MGLQRVFSRGVDSPDGKGRGLAPSFLVRPFSPPCTSVSCTGLDGPTATPCGKWVRGFVGCVGPDAVNDNMRAAVRRESTGQ
eukprot:4901894-Pyramimonas_sp.AAC.1